MATVLFISPHQDDETLTMGAAISNHIHYGHDVHVVLATTGINSAVRGQTGLSRTQFTAARDDEFRRACRELGVPDGNVHVSRHAVDDGALTVTAARDVIRAALDEHPGAWVKTHTDRGEQVGQHADHTHLGQAAMQLHDEGIIDNLRLYVEPYHVSDFEAAHGAITSTETTPTPEAVRDALDEYRRSHPQRGMHGIGYLSVPSYIDMVDANPVSYMHEP